MNVEQCTKLKRLSMMKSLVDKSKNNRAINVNRTDILVFCLEIFRKHYILNYVNDIPIKHANCEMRLNVAMTWTRNHIYVCLHYKHIC